MAEDRPGRTWNYRIIKHDTQEESSYHIHEVYYHTNGDIRSYSANPIAPCGDTIDQLLEDLDMMKRDMQGKPILSLTELEEMFKNQES